MEKIRVVIADDHGLVRLALRTLLEDEPDIEVVGEAADSDQACDLAIGLEPDVLVLDMRMPGGGGVEVCRRVRKALPGLAILIVTSFDDDEELFGVLDAGACGYLMKDTRPDRIVTAVRAIHDGQYVFDAVIASKMVAGRTGAPAGTIGATDQLTERELEVLSLIARGYSNKDIARELWLGESTIKTHVSHVLHKLGASDRTTAALMALGAGLVRLEENFSPQAED